MSKTQLEITIKLQAEELNDEKAKEIRTIISDALHAEGYSNFLLWDKKSE